MEQSVNRHTSLGQAFSRAVEGGSQTDTSRVFNEAISDPVLRETLTSLVGGKRDLYVFDGQNWIRLEPNFEGFSGASGGQNGEDQSAAETVPAPNAVADAADADASAGEGEEIAVASLVTDGGQAGEHESTVVAGAPSFTEQVAGTAFRFDREAERLAAALAAVQVPPSAAA